LDKNNIIFKILKYYYIDNMTQSEISEKLNITRVAVSRYISKARKEGLIEFKIKYPSNFNIERIENLETEFKKIFKLKECIIIPMQSTQKETLKELSDQLADLLSKIMKDNTFIGVGWGNTLDNLVNFMEVKDKRNIKVVPLVGGYGRIFDDTHSNDIARVLAEKFNGISYIVNIPALVDTKEIKEYIQRDRAAIEIFKMAKRVEVALLCMGDLSMESSLYKTGQLTKDDLEYLSNLGVIGDINYIFIDNDGNFVPNEISERIINIFPLELMKKVKNVIGVAIGLRKAKILHTVLKAGLINIVLTDETAARKILEFN